MPSHCHSQKTWLKMNSAILKVVGKLGRGTSHKDLRTWPMTVIIILFPLDIGRSVTIVMWDQGYCGMDSGMSLPGGSMWGTLACAQSGTYLALSN